MTDPRIAALAEALHAEMCGCSWQPCITEHRNRAATILAALPPDWCGHNAKSLFWKQADMEAEIARLRPIEEAARAHAEISHVPGMETDTLVALRAALEAEG